MRHQSQEIRAGVTLHDANLLKIKTEYGYEMKIPLAGKIIAETMAQLYPENSHFFRAGRIPLTSVATVRMQNEARRSNPSTPVIAVSETDTNVDAESAVVSDPTVATGPLPECDEHGLGPLEQGNFSQPNLGLLPDDPSQLQECVSPLGVVGNLPGRTATGDHLVGGSRTGSSPIVGDCA